MDKLWESSHLSGGMDYVESIYESYLADPTSVPEQWQQYFADLPAAASAETAHSAVREQFAELAKAKVKVAGTPVSDGALNDHERKQIRVIQLCTAYRLRGHQQAKLDPLGLWQRPQVPDLTLEYHGLSEADLDTVFNTGSLYIGKYEATLREILEALQETYCGSVGAEFMHVTDTEERHWIQQRMDSVRSKPDTSDETRKYLLWRLTAAEMLEKSLATKYPGVKRFGLEGGESLIPMVGNMIQRFGGYGAKEIVIGMAHRGRLNMLINILGKNPSDLFAEFEGKAEYVGSADVKYHQGFSSNMNTPGGEVHLALAFNPSHLEIVSPVVEGSVRARQERRKDAEGELVVPISIHGDAAFAGQGVVMETFQMSQTRAYKTGGTIHIVINNQVGFTTSKQEDARSTEYCTDIAKMVQAPIFHVNGDDPEAVLFVSQLAVDYRHKFKKDIVIDMICYRRRGHNEADEPSGTQPLMYKQIAQQRSTRDLYAEKLIADGVITNEQDSKLIADYRRDLEEGRHVVKHLVSEPNEELFVDWTPYLGHDWDAPGDTRLPLDRLKATAKRMNETPAAFSVQRQVSKVYEDRNAMAAGDMPVNWGFAETLAYATLLEDGHPIRMTGQDIGRGTFSHRHAVLHSQNDAGTYVPLQNLNTEQAPLVIHDSFLSEEAVLAFEYGYATTQPNGLVIWEAQFGDFANGAQVVIDQFITSGEHKWQRLCGLTMLLPHGYEGQGPEHSSARLERFLQMCAEHNIQVCVPSTPAQVYHMLRRQAIRPTRKPLIVMSPKSLLRHKEAVSTLDELANGHFHNVLDEAELTDKSKVRRLVMCSGKVYYDLVIARREHNIDDIALIRLEQLYPFPEQELEDILKAYPNVESVVWCQEEPMNQGAWYCSQHHMRHVVERVFGKLYVSYAGREPSAAPAAGYMALHVKQQKQLIADALELND
jgi:2-oxoglutarate dehydrogenase E1 component